MKNLQNDKGIAAFLFFILKTGASLCKVAAFGVSRLQKSGKKLFWVLHTCRSEKSYFLGFRTFAEVKKVTFLDFARLQKWKKKTDVQLAAAGGAKASAFKDRQ